MYLAVPNSGSAVLGFMGSGGLSLCLTALLVFGVIGKGARRLNTLWAGIIAFAAASAYMAAGKIWRSPQQVVEQGWTGLGVGGGTGPFGEIGIGAACTLLVILMWVAPLNPTRAAVLGMVAALTWPLAGDGAIWSVPVQFIAAVFMMFGGA
ncbi:hypothetical protein ACN6LM_003892 [Streptomyces sp. SAS_281]|uniref:hypothetical protein n=1 Tax=Streptomyces sp. SAS_281 TaxID=3412744 RepID=UPI00403C0BCC